MARLSPLPSRLCYLGPFRKQIARLDPEEINEDTDLTLVRKAVRERVNGLSDAQARAALRDDGAELESWLSAPEQKNDVLHFLLPFFSMDAVEVLLQQPVESPPEQEVSIVLPHGAKVSKEHGCWSVRWHKMLVSLYPADAGTMDSETARFRDEAKRRPMQDGDGIEVTDVDFGTVRGIRRVYKQVWSAPAKRVDYALEVPGGAVIAIVQSMKGKPDFEESEVEGQFHTLQIIKHKGSMNAEGIQS
jgi:hypothetical protein